MRLSNIWKYIQIKFTGLLSTGNIGLYTKDSKGFAYFKPYIISSLRIQE
jgi:hypothetical protein